MSSQAPITTRQRILEHLGQKPEGDSLNGITRALQGNPGAIRNAVNAMLRAGLIDERVVGTPPSHTRVLTMARARTA